MLTLKFCDVPVPESGKGTDEVSLVLSWWVKDVQLS